MTKPKSRITVSKAALLALTLVACGGPSAPSSVPPAQAGETLLVPQFAVDDPLVGTAGFVARTTRINRPIDGTTFTLMAFAVGDVFTLGAMVEGPFEGTAHWTVGQRTFSVPVRRSNRGTTDIAVFGQAFVGQHGSFNAFDWGNVEVPIDEWLPNGTRVRLEFEAEGARVVLPDDDRWFVAEVEPR